MQNNLKKILSTKRLNEEQLLLLKESFDVTHLDIIETKKSQVDLDKCSENIIFTSFKAAQIGLRLLAEDTICKNYYCVGGKTESLLQMLGLNIVKCTPYSKDLARYILRHHSKEKFSYLCNENRLDDLPEMLEEGNVNVEEFITYQSSITDTTQVNVAGHAVYMWYSPMGVEALASQVADEKGWHIAIGATTADKLIKENIKSDKILFPKVPSIDGMIELINNHIK